MVCYGISSIIWLDTGTIQEYCYISANRCKHILSKSGWSLIPQVLICRPPIQNHLLEGRCLLFEVECYFFYTQRDI